MFRQGICSCGERIAPFVTTVNGEIYPKKCLQKHLLSLVKQYRGPTIFWSDLAYLE